MLLLLSLSIRMQQSDSQSDLPCVGLIGQHLYGLIGMTTLLSLAIRMQHSNSQSDWPCVGLIGKHLLWLDLHDNFVSLTNNNATF